MKKILCMLLLLCFLTGCGAKHEKSVTLYFVSEDRSDIKIEKRAIDADASVLESAIRALLEGPKTTGLARIIPAETKLKSIKETGTVVEIDLTAAFDAGTDADRLLARYTVIYTACAVENVQKVKLLVEGKPLRSLRTGEPLSALGTADLIQTMPQSGSQMLLTLYFPDTNYKKLYPSARQVTLLDGQTVEEAVVTALIKGPSEENLAEAVTGDVKVYSAETKNGICFVNVSETFIKENTGDSQKEKMTLYSIVNSLCTLPQVKEVRFLIEGKAVQSFGYMPLNISYFADETLQSLR